ncbi:MAG: LCP family protein [Acidimicrobiia bacterium]
MTRSVALMVAAILLTACTPSAEPTIATTTTSTTRPPTTTLTVIETAPTTTLPPPVVTAAIDDTPQGLADTVAEFYAWVLDPALEPPNLPAGLIAAFAKPPGPRVLHIEGQTTTAEVQGSQLAVVQAADDVVLAVDDGPGWRVVGAHLTRFDAPAWYGDPPRLLLMIGSDARPGQNPLIFRADSLHILGIDPARSRGSLLGIPRDTLVTKLDGTEDKLTHAMASVGPEVLTQTAENLTGLDFDGYIVTGFKGFIDVVNAFGGFTFDIPFGITDEKAEADFRRGVQHLNGAEALAWSRIRKIKGGDFQRQLNGGELLIAMLIEAREGGMMLLDVPAMLEIFTRFVATDLTPEELLTMAAAVVELDPPEIDNLVAPGMIGRAVGRSVVFLDEVAFEMFEDIADGVLDGTYEPFP